MSCANGAGDIIQDVTILLPSQKGQVRLKGKLQPLEASIKMKTGTPLDPEILLERNI